MEERPSGKDPIQVASDVVLVGRSLIKQEKSIIAVLTLTALRDVPVAVQIVDDFPADCPIETAAFHKNHEPSQGRIDETGVTFEELVPPDEEVVIVYMLFTPKIEGPISFSPPLIKKSQPVDPVMVRGGAGEGEHEGENEDEDESEGESDFYFDSPAGDTPTDESPDPDTTTDEGDGMASSAHSGADEEGSSETATRGTATNDADGEEPSTDSNADARTAGDARTGDASDTDSVVEAFMAELEEGRVSDEQLERLRDVLGPDRRDQPVPEQRAEPSVEAGEGIVEAFVTELQKGGVADEQVSALRAELGIDVAGSESIDTRLRHLHGRMDEFAVYIDALEELINEHGTASAFMEDVRSELNFLGEELTALDDEFDECQDELDAIRKELDDVRSRLTAAEDEHSDLHERVDAMATELETIDKRMEDGFESIRERVEAVFDTVQGELEDIRSTQTQNIDEVKEEVETLAAEVDERFEAMETAVETLQGKVEKADIIRKVLVEAFGQLEEFPAMSADIQDESDAEAEMKSRFEFGSGE